MVYHYDVSQAFVHALPEVPIIIQFPSGYLYEGKYKYARLYNALYGLRTAGASWMKLAHKFLMGFRYQGCSFIQSTYDPYLYFIFTSTVVAFCVVYVDDFGLACDPEFQKAFWEAFSSTFLSKNLGRMTAVLQLTVAYDSRGIYLSQTRQITELMQKFKLKPKPQMSPMDEKLIIKKPDEPDLSLVTPYLSLLGSLLWIARCTRPDIYYSIIYLAQAHRALRSSPFRPSVGSWCTHITHGTTGWLTTTRLRLSP